MKTTNTKPIQFLIVSLLVLMGSACGKSNSGAVAGAPYVGGVGTGPNGTYGNGTTGACMPISGGVLQFQGSFTVDTANVVTSQYPAVQQTGGGYPTQFQSYPACAPQQIPGYGSPCSPSGQLMMNLTPVSQISATMKLGVGTGMLQLSQNMMATLQPYMNGCATVVGVNLGRAGNLLYGGYVTIAINGGQTMNLPF